MNLQFIQNKFQTKFIQNPHQGCFGNNTHRKGGIIDWQCKWNTFSNPTIDLKLLTAEIIQIQVGLGVYIRYFKSIGYLYCTIIVLGGIANQAFSVYSSMWLSDWSADPENNIPATRDMYLGVYGGLGIAQSNFVVGRRISFR